MTTKKQETKPFYASKSFWGIAILVATVTLKKYLGIDIDEETGSLITEDTMTIIGSALAIWGRLSAAKGITLK